MNIVVTETNKKENKRYRQRIIIFVGIFLILFAAMLWLFSNHPDHRTYQMIGGFYEEPENSLDGVYVGSSNCYAFWNPLVAWNNYGLTIYPYSSGSQPFYATEYIIREARKTQPDAVYIVNLNSVEADDMDMNAIHNLINYMPESKIKDELIDYLGGLLGCSRIENLEFRFPWIRTREYWLDYLKKGFSPELDGLKGTMRYGDYLKTYTDITDAYILSDAQADIPNELTECINSLLDYCDAENVNVLFVSVPRAEESETALGRINTVCDMIRTRGYDVLYLTDKAERVSLDLSQDYYNNEHTNIHGAIKYTNYLSEYLIENYGLENKHGNELYSSWDNAWDIYAKGVSPGILDIELDAAHRDYALAAPEGLEAKSDGSGAIAVEWNAVEGAHAYAVYRKAGYTSPWELVSAHQATTSYLDSDCTDGIECYYTVVPVRDADGEAFYGNFYYRGVSTTI